MSQHAADGPHEAKRETVFLQVPRHAERPEEVDLELIASIIRSGVLTAEIDAANNFDPDLAV